MEVKYEDPRLTSSHKYNNYKIIINIPEINLKTGRTSSVSEGRKEATSKTVESTAMWFGTETDQGHHGGQGDAVLEKDKR